MICSKISIAFFLLRIAVRKIHSYIIYAAMTISVVAGAAFFFVTLFQCNPVSFFWTKHLPGQPGTCVDMTIVIALGYVYSAFSIISDFTFALLPAHLVMGLQLKRKTKIALIPLLTMGCIASSAVVARLPYVLKIGAPDFLCESCFPPFRNGKMNGLDLPAIQQGQPLTSQSGRPLSKVSP